MRVLIVDDHSDFRASVRRRLESEGYEVVVEEAAGGLHSRARTSTVCPSPVPPAGIEPAHAV